MRKRTCQRRLLFETLPGTDGYWDWDWDWDWDWAFWAGAEFR